MNRRDLEKKLSPITSELFKEKDYICLIDIYIGLGYLTEKDVELWRMKKVPYLEKVIKVNLGKINFINKTVHENSSKGGLRESHTAYKSWGKGAKVNLRFSKSGAINVEALYSTHWLKPKKLA